MRRLLALLLLAAPLAAQTPTPTPTPTVSPTPTRTPTPTMTPTPYRPSRYSLAAQVRPGFGTFQTEATVNKLGDTYYAVDFQTFARLAGNTSSTKKFLTQTGTGSVSAAPTWATISAGDVPTLNQNTTGSAAKWTTARLLAGNSVDGSANVAFSNKFVVQGTADSGLSGAQFLGALGTGIVKNTTTTGVLSIALAGDFPTLNQSTTGNADTATLAAAANALKSATTTVDVSAATAPVAGKVLTATDSTHATWQTPVSGVSSVDSIGGAISLVAGTGVTITDNSPVAGSITIASTGGTGTTATKQDEFTGDGVTTAFSLSASPTASGIIFVALNGLPQPTSAWTPSGSTITMGVAPISGALLSVGYYTSLASGVTHTQEDFTGAGSTDFTLAHTPAVDGVLAVSLRGLVQPQTAWTLVAGTTLRFASAVPSGDAVSISYNY